MRNRGLPALRDLDRFDAWLHRLLVNSCLDALRRRRRRPIEIEINPIDEPGTADSAAHLADRDPVERALARLDPEPQAQRVERAYRTHTEESYEVTDAEATLADLRPAQLAWEETDNTVRPHQALRYLTPAEYLATLPPKV